MQEEGRIGWDEYFMDVAKTTAKRASCLRRKEGAVIVKNKQILSTGFNGAPKGVQDCMEKGRCMRREKGIKSGEKLEFCMATHAEQNAIIQAACNGIKIEGAMLYCTSHPCILCAKVIINSGIRKVVYGKAQSEFSGKTPESDILAQRIFEEAGIRVTQFKKENEPGH